MRFFLQPAALALLATGAPAGAATFTVDVTGWCTINCASVGLAENDRFAGTVDVDDAGFDPGQFDTSAITAFSFSFGSFALDQSGVAIANNLVRWGSTGDAVEEIYIFAFGSDTASTPGPYLSLAASINGLGTGYAALDAFFATDGDGQWAGSEGHGAYLNTDVLASDPQSPVPIPLPAAGWLLGGALLGLGILRGPRRL